MRRAPGCPRAARRLAGRDRGLARATPDAPTVPAAPRIWALSAERRSRAHPFVAAQALDVSGEKVVSSDPPRTAACVDSARRTGWRS